MRTMHAVNHKMKLAITGHIATRCTHARGGSVTVEFEVLGPHPIRCSRIQLPSQFRCCHRRCQ